MINTTTQKGDFKQGVINFLLFSSMSNPAEMYLSKEIKSKTQSMGKLKSLKDTISKTIDNKFGMLRKTKESSLDHEIETAMDNTKDSGQGNPDFLAKMVDYNSEEKKPMDMIKSALKNLYSTFVSYTKSTYSAVTSSANKIVEGPVKITMLKLIRVFEYVLTALNPQWNRVPGSPQDLDTLAPAITNHIITDKENLKYNSGYGALMYWHK